MLHIKLKTITKPLPQTLGMDPIGQNLNFSEHGLVAYPNERNHKCTHMVANILPQIPYTPNPGDEVNRSKFNFKFSEHGHVAYQIKWNPEI